MPIVRAGRPGVPRPMARAVAPLTIALVALVAACAPDRARDEARERARTAAFDRSARRFTELAARAPDGCEAAEFRAVPGPLAVHLALTCRGARAGFTLRPPSADRSHPAARFFQIEPDDDASAAGRERASRLLAAAFTADPWTVSSGTFDAANAVDLGRERLILATLALSLAAALAYVLAARPAARSGEGAGRPVELPLAAVAALVALAWLLRFDAGAWTGHDQTTGLLMARDCVERSTCQLTGVDSGVRGFTNGALWPHLLSAVGLLGGASVALSRTLAALMAAAVGAVFVCTWRWLRPAAAPAAALLTLLGVASGHGPSAGPGDLSTTNLVDASFAFFPTTLCACALLVFVLTSRPAALVAAAVLASHALNTHVAGASLLPALVASAALAGRRPLLSAALAVATHLAATLVSSPEALRNSLSHLQPAEKYGALAALAALAVACALAAPLYRRLGPSARAAVLGAWLVAPTAGGVLLLHLAHRELSTRYFAPVIAPLAVAAAALMVLAVDLATHRRPRLAPLAWALPALVAVVALVRAQPPRSYPVWTFEDGRVVAAHLARRGWCYSRQFARLQTPRCTTLAYAVMPYACYAERDPGAAAARRQVRAFVADPARLPPLPRGAAVLPVHPGRAVVLSEVDSWVDTADAELCVTGLGPGASPQPACTRPDAPDAEPFLYAHRLALGFRDANLAQPFRMTYSFALRPAAGQSRRIAFPDDAGSGVGARPGAGNALGCGWQVARVEGAEADRPLPANPVVLRSRDGTPGRIVLERVVGAAPCMNPFPGQQIPCRWETTPDDPAWMQEQAF
jgi:hypothetical protein